MIEVQRLQAGVLLAGPHYMIQLTPVSSADSLGSPTVSVSVLARPALTGDDRNVRLEAYDVRHDFRLVDIAVDPQKCAACASRTSVHRGSARASRWRSRTAWPSNWRPICRASI